MPTAEPTIVIEDRPDEHRYVLLVDGEEAGFIQYRPMEGGLDLVHTVVEDRFEGRGLAGTLAAGALDDLRRRGLRLKPTCPYLRSWLDRHPEYQDLVAS